MNTLMIALMSWIAVATGYTLPASETGSIQPPSLEYKTPEQMWYSVMPGQPYDESGTRGVLAYYHGGVVYLNHNWDGSKIKDVGILVHELTHYMQDINLVDITNLDPCEGSTVEKEAYEVHRKFIAGTGVEDEWKVMGIDPLYTLFLTQCMNGQ